MLLDEFTVFKSRYPANGLYIDWVEAVPFAFYSLVVEMILQIPFGLPNNLCRKCMYELKGTSKNDATDVKLGRSRGSRGSRAGLGSGFSVFSGSPAGLFPSPCGLQADVSLDDRHVGAAAPRRSNCTRRRML